MNAKSSHALQPGVETVPDLLHRGGNIVRKRQWSFRHINPPGTPRHSNKYQIEGPVNRHLEEDPLRDAGWVTCGSGRSYPAGSFRGSSWLDLLNNGAIDGVNRTGRFDFSSIFLMPGVRGKLDAIHLIFGHGTHINRGERFAGGAC